MANSNVTNKDIMARLKETLEQGAKEDLEREEEERRRLRNQTPMERRERFYSARVWPVFEGGERDEWDGE